MRERDIDREVRSGRKIYPPVSKVVGHKLLGKRFWPWVIIYVLCRFNDDGSDAGAEHLRPRDQRRGRGAAEAARVLLQPEEAAR